MKLPEVQQLMQPGALPGGETAHKLLETHISWVILGERFAYKIKKPVKLHFLDFSSPEKRLHYCQRELQLNRRFSPEIYLDLLPIVQEKSGSIRIKKGEEAAAIDHCLRMKLLEQELQMDHCLQQGEVSEKQIQQLARRVAEFHAGAPPLSSFPDADALWYLFKDLHAALLFLEELGEAEKAAHIREACQWAQRFLAEHSDLIETRGQQGWVRDLHGDLHSGNVFLYDPPILFDCIEFNDAFRQIDVLDEIAFMAMDLKDHGFPDLAAAFLSAYGEAMQLRLGASEKQLLRYYQAYRANVRAKVHLIAAEQADSPTQRDQQLKQAFAYLDLMIEEVRKGEDDG
jgi:aminoglycoside phosphotransferase family enzyme